MRTHTAWVNFRRYESLFARVRSTNPARDTSHRCCCKGQHQRRLVSRAGLAGGGAPKTTFMPTAVGLRLRVNIKGRWYDTSDSGRPPPEVSTKVAALRFRGFLDFN